MWGVSWGWCVVKLCTSVLSSYHKASGAHEPDVTAPDRLWHPLVPAAGPLSLLVLVVFWVPPTFSPALGKPRPALLCSLGGLLLVTFLRQLISTPWILKDPSAVRPH